MDYAVPYPSGLPDFDITLTGVPTNANPLGVKGSGQAGAIAAPQAIIAAVLDALAPLGVRSYRHAGHAGTHLARDQGGDAHMIGRRQLGLGAAALALSPVIHRGARRRQRQERASRCTSAEPQVFDPHQSGVNATQEHAALIYDTLFTWDGNMVPRRRWWSAGANPTTASCTPSPCGRASSSTTARR